MNVLIILYLIKYFEATKRNCFDRMFRNAKHDDCMMAA